MLPPHSQQPKRPAGPSLIRFGKHVRVEDVADEQDPSGRPNNVPSSSGQHVGEAHRAEPAGDGHHIHGQQPKQQDTQRGQTTEQHHSTEDKKERPQADGQPQTHEHFTSPGVGATPQNPGVFLHTTSNPTMALGYSQGYSFLPTQDPNIGVNLPHITTYIGTPNMTDYRNVDFQNGALNHPQGLHFQPPVPDTTYGPMTHIYVPRHDSIAPQVVAGGPVQVPLQPQVTVGTNPILTVHHQTPATTIQPHVAAQPGVVVGGHVMPGTFPVQPAPNPVMYATSPGTLPGVPGVPGSVTVHLPPNVTGIGKTVAEIHAYHQDVAMADNALKPEDFQPASKDPAKMYYCRELDGNWTLRSRYSIDKMGDWRWYQTPGGIFYAVRLPN